MGRNNPKHIVITGASSGIGAALAKAYAAPDIHLSICARNPTRLLKTFSACKTKGAEVHSALLDVTDTKAMENWLVARDNERPIDLIIANAGLSLKQTKLTIEGNEIAEHRLIDTHIKGTLNTLRPILPRMQARKQGQVAIMSSLNAFIVIPGSKVYGAIKAALLHYGLGLRASMRDDNISVNVICPGWVKTPLTNLNEFQMPGILSSEKAALKIQKELRRNKAVIAFPLVPYLLCRLTGILPIWLQQFITNKLKHYIHGHMTYQEPLN